MPRNKRREILLDAGYQCPCGCRYRNRFKVEVAGKDESEASDRALRIAKRKGLRDIPCPECGRYATPNGSPRSRAGTVGLALAALSLAVLIAFASILAPLNSIVGAVTGVVAALFAALNVVCLLLLRNLPSKSRRRRALALAARGKVHSIVPPTESSQVPAGAIRPLLRQLMIPWIGAALLLAVGIGIPYGCPGYNFETHPRFVAPGREVEYSFDDIHSVKGHWRGTPVIDARIEPEGTPLKLAATGRDDHWANRIDVKTGDVEQRATPTVRFTLPADPSLEGKSIDANIKMNVSYPSASAGIKREGEFNQAGEPFRSRITINVSSELRVALFTTLWWVGSLSGVACLVMPSFVRFMRSRSSEPSDEPLDLRIAAPAPLPPDDETGK
jgi:hypothetical protein